MGPLDLILLLLLAGAAVATLGRGPTNRRCSASRPHLARHGKMCCRGRGMWLWMPVMFVLPAIGCWILFSVIIFGGGHHRMQQYRLAMRRAQEKQATSREALRLKRQSLEKLRDARTRGVGESTIEVVFRPERVMAEGLDAKDLARGIRRLVAEIEASRTGDSPRGVVPLVKLNAVVVRGDALGTVRLSDVARLSRRRTSGRAAWRDTELLIRFEGGDDSAPDVGAEDDASDSESADSVDLEKLKIALEATSNSEEPGSQLSSGTDVSRPRAGIWRIADHGVLAFGFSPPAGADAGSLIPDVALQPERAEANNEGDARREDLTDSAGADRLARQEDPAAAASKVAGKPKRSQRSPETQETGSVPAAQSDEGRTVSSNAATGLAVAERKRIRDATRAAASRTRGSPRSSEAAPRGVASHASGAKAAADRAASELPSPLAVMRGPDDPPEWIDRPSYFANGVYHLYAKDGPFIDREQCEEALPDLLRRETQRYVQRYLGLGSEAEPVAFSLAVIQAEMLQGVWIGPWRDTSDGVLPSSDLFDRYALHVALEFDDADRAYFERVWNQQQVRHRLWATAIGSGSLLALLAIVFGYLKVDTATRGYYSGRLKLAAVGGAMAVVGGAVALLAN